MKRENPAELKARILDGAIDMWNEKGVRFTMSELAAHLRVSKKTLYVHFADKEELLAAAVDHWFDEVKLAERAILDDETLSLFDKLSRVIVVQPAGRTPISWTDVAPTAAKYPRVYERVVERLETGWEPTLELMREGIEAGVFRPVDVELVRGVVEGAFERLLSAPPIHADWNETLEAMIDIVLFGMVSRGDIAPSTAADADAVTP